MAPDPWVRAMTAKPFVQAEPGVVWALAGGNSMWKLLCARWTAARCDCYCFWEDPRWHRCDWERRKRSDGSVHSGAHRKHRREWIEEYSGVKCIVDSDMSPLSKIDTEILIKVQLKNYISFCICFNPCALPRSIISFFSCPVLVQFESSSSPALVQF